MPTTIGAPFVLLIALSFLFYKKGDENLAERLFFAMACLSLFMASSLFPWDTDLPVIGSVNGFLAKIQFPWRFLSFATLFLTIYSILVLSRIQSKLPNLASMLTVLILAVSLLEASYGITSYVRDGDTTNAATILAEYDGVFDAQFIPAKTYRQRPDFSIDEPVPITSGITVKEYGQKGCELRLTIALKNEGEVALPLLEYPYYKLEASNGSIDTRLSSNSKGQIILYATGSGETQVTIRFCEPPAWRLAETCSFATLSGICIYLQKRRPWQICRNI